MTGRSKLLAVVALLWALSIPGAGFGQDAQYWTNQYGNQARLLAGSVIGSANDLAAVFYNPGALALVSDAQLLLAANVGEYTNYTVEIEGAESESLGSTSIGSAPSLFAGEINFKFLGDSRFAYSFLTRYSANIRLNEKALIDSTSGIPLPELDAAAVGLLFEESLTETWVGVTWSTPIGGRWGFGVSPYLTIRSQRLKDQTTIQAIDSAGNATIALNGEDLDFLNWRLLAKIGGSARYGPLWFGATVTTPSLNLAGSGNAAVEQSLVTQDGTGDLFVDLQEGVAVDYKSPASLGAGVGYTWKEATTLHVAAEYFAAIDPNPILDLEPIVDPETRDTLAEGLIQEAEDVLNWAVGLQHVFSEKLEGYAGVHSDFSSRPEGQSAVFPVSRWDIWHVSGGVTATLGRSKFTLGGIVA